MEGASAVETGHDPHSLLRSPYLRTAHLRAIPCTAYGVVLGSTYAERSEGMAVD
jgi:hypothetical protein